MSENSIRLTQYSHGAGCGCKISPKVLETILHSEQAKFVVSLHLAGHAPLSINILLHFYPFYNSLYDFSTFFFYPLNYYSTYASTISFDTL